jgi:uncharacterized lipoprotein YajG
MKLGLFAALLLLAACSPPQTSRPSGNRTAGTPSTSQSTASPNTVSQDAAECERQAAVSASAGSRAQAFNDCMKARGRAPGR